ncbi:AraC family transcriptional regulator [Parasediminibacterium sp. JCM 36343]|uniref:AraC family transcriptional regulator n=1 Tax=Parasediminibacterium sp. JCM 36343 TaxID=3374279 RepID=UPI0039792486
MKEIGAIPSISIDTIIANTGRAKAANDFHVFKSSELDKTKRPARPVRIDHFIIVLVTEGTAHIKINLVDYRIEKNSLLIISPNTIHEFIQQTDYHFIGTGFVPAFLSQIGFNKKHIDAFGFFSTNSDPYFPLAQKEADILVNLMLMLHEKDHSTDEHPFKEEVIHHAFNLLMFELAAIARKYRENTVVKLTRKEDILMAFLRVLPLHFKEERSVQFYASLLFITPKHLTKTVKEITNKTCGELIDDMVIMEAKVLLNDVTLSVANVADLLNFSDQFFFSKFFKKHTSLTPSEYRKSL